MTNYDNVSKFHINKSSYFEIVRLPLLSAAPQSFVIEYAPVGRGAS